MTPVDPTSRRAYTDPRDVFYVGHLLEAAHLIERGHPLLHLELVGYTRRDQQPGTRYAFNRSAIPDLETYRKAVVEVSAQKERFLEARRRQSTTSTSSL